MSASGFQRVRLQWTFLTLRHWRKSLGAYLFLVMILGVGVAAFLGIRLANRSAVAGFNLFTESLSGGPKAVVIAQSGSIPSVQLPDIRAAFGVQPVVLLPVHPVTAQRVHPDGTMDTVDIIGLDFVATRNLQNIGSSPSSGLFPDSEEGMSSWADTVTGQGRFLFPSVEAAQTHKVSVGDSLQLMTGEGESEWTIGAVLPPETQAPATAFYTDLSLLNELGVSLDRIERVDVYTLSSQNVGNLEAVQSALPQGLTVRSREDQKAAADSMSRAFRMNLSALSLLALLVSLYLILQALDAAVVRRRGEIAVLRSLGVEPKDIRRAWFLEALMLGAVGSGIGVLLGIGVAYLAVGSVTETVSNLYVRSSTRAMLYSGGEISAAFALGLVASVLAGWLPARDAAMTPPAEVLSKSRHRLPIQLLDHPAFGWALLAVFAGTYFLPPLSLAGGLRFPAFGYLSALSFAVALAILMCSVFPVLGRLAPRFFPRQCRLRYAASQLRNPTGRHKLAMSGLLIAVAMAGGITLLVASFQNTIEQWLAHQLKADLFLSSKNFSHASSSGRISSEALLEMTDREDVADVEYTQIFRMELDGMSTYLTGVRLRENLKDSQRRLWIEKPPTGLSVLNTRLETGLVPCIVSEPFSRKFNVSAGDRVTLPIPGGSQEALIRGVFADYGNEHGVLVVNASYTRTWFEEDRAATVGLYLDDHVDRAGVLSELKASYPGLEIRDNAGLRNEVITVFRQTFAVTGALKGIGIVVAVFGLVLSQFSLVTERRGELGVLRELGWTRRDVSLSSAWESVLIAVIGTAGGLLGALVLGHILIFVINRQSFGWTLKYTVPAADYAGFMVLMLAAAGMAGGIAGFVASAMEVEREE